MNISRDVLTEAARQGLLSAGQADQLWQFLVEQSAARPSFRSAHILYYFGGLIAIGAMSLFMTLGWEVFGGRGLLIIALVYAGFALWLTEGLLRRGLPVPAGITATLVVVLTPLAIYGLQVETGWWHDQLVYHDYHIRIDWRSLLMELATLAVASVLLWRYGLPFLVMPLAVTLWYMSMDLTPFLFSTGDPNWELRKQVSLVFGLLMIVLAFSVDLRTARERDFAFWLYLFGVVAFWGGLSFLRSDGELGRFVYFCVNLLMIVVGALLTRRVFVVCGGLGVTGYLGHLAHSVFHDSIAFPFVLTVIGLGIVGCGIVWQRHEEAIARAVQACLPPSLRELVRHD